MSFNCLFPHQQLAQNFHSNFLRGPEHEKVIFASNAITIKILKNQSMNNILYDGLTIDEEWKITPNVFPLEVLVVCTCNGMS